MAGFGTPRRFAAVRRFGRDRNEADMQRTSGVGRSDENDPERTSTLISLGASGTISHPRCEQDAAAVQRALRTGGFRGWLLYRGDNRPSSVSFEDY